ETRDGFGRPLLFTPHSAARARATLATSPAIRTAPSTLSPTAAARRVAAPTRPGASRRLGTAGHSRPGHPLPSRRLGRRRVGRWGRRFWGGQLAHPGDDALSLESLQRSLDNVLDVPADVADGLGQSSAGFRVELRQDLFHNLAPQRNQLIPACRPFGHRFT